MIFRDLYETLENIDIRVVDGKKGYYAKVTDPDFDYDAIADREIERIFVDAQGNIVAELKYKPAITGKDLLSTCVSNRNIKVVWTGRIQYTRKARCIEIYGDRKVKSWDFNQLYISIMIDGEMLPELESEVE